MNDINKIHKLTHSSYKNLPTECKILQMSQKIMQSYRLDKVLFWLLHAGL